jgi:hypothetical protein
LFKKDTELNSEALRRINKIIRQFLLYPHHVAPVGEWIRLDVGIVFLCQEVAVHSADAVGF